MTGAIAGAMAKGRVRQDIGSEREVDGDVHAGPSSETPDRTLPERRSRVCVEARASVPAGSGVG